MIVNHTYNFIFLHIPKSGGTFARSILEAIPGNEFPQGDAHFGVHLLEGKYKNYKKIVIIRDPIEWYVSLYEHIQLGGPVGKETVQEWIAFKGESFSEWLDNILNLQPHPECFNHPRIVGEWSTAHAVRFLENNRFNFGWWTYILIYQTITDWQYFLQHFHVDEFIDKTEADFILNTNNLNKELYDTLIKLGVPEKFAKPALSTNPINVGSYSRNKYSNIYTNDYLSNIIEKESLIYSLLNV